MADYKYSYQGSEQGTAKALLKDVGISTKVSIEVANYLRGRSTAKAKKILELVIEKKHAIPFKRFTNGVGHRPGPLGAGRYPLKTSESFKQLIELAEANASQKGLSDELVICHLNAQRASTPWKHGRQRRRKQKRTHIEIVIKEDENAVKKKAKKKPSQEAASESQEQVVAEQTSKETVTPPKKTVKKVVKKTEDVTRSEAQQSERGEQKSEHSEQRTDVREAQGSDVSEAQQSEHSEQRTDVSEAQQSEHSEQRTDVSVQGSDRSERGSDVATPTKETQKDNTNNDDQENHKNKPVQKKESQEVA